MKKLISKYWLVLMALVSVTLFTACSSDDDDAVTPVFPQVQTIAGAAGDELDFTFDANENWSLASSAIWCKLVQGENDAFVLNGTAGKQTIKVKITADDACKDMSVAQLFLTMGGQKVAIAEVKRSAAGSSSRFTMSWATISPRQVSSLVTRTSQVSLSTTSSLSRQTIVLLLPILLPG